MPSARIELCGRLAVEIDGREVDPPGRQGRLVLAYLAVHRGRPVTRDELIALLWPERLPADPGEALSALLAKLRRALGAGALEGRGALTLRLDAAVDLDEARSAADAAEHALERADWPAAHSDAAAALDVARRGFLSGESHPWAEEQRRGVEALRARSLHAAATAGLRLGGAELAGAEAAARELVAAAPLNEAGHRLLMEILVARGDTAEALRAYERLRAALRDELGATPGAAILALRAGDHEGAHRLLVESLLLRRDAGDRPGLAQSLDALAELAAAAGDGERAARLHGSAAALRVAAGVPLHGTDSAALEEALERLHAALGGAFAPAFTEGEATPLAGALAYACEPAHAARTRSTAPLSA